MTINYIMKIVKYMSHHFSLAINPTETLLLLFIISLNLDSNSDIFLHPVEIVTSQKTKYFINNDFHWHFGAIILFHLIQKLLNKLTSSEKLNHFSYDVIFDKSV